MAAVEIVLENFLERARALEAVVRIERHGPRADGSQLGRRVGYHVEDLRIVSGDATREQAGLAVALHHASAGHCLPEHHADGEEIGALVDGRAAGLLGRHVRELPLEDTLLGARRSAGGLGDAEVDDLHLAVIGDEHVLRAHVAVNHAEGRSVEVGQGVGVLETGEHVGEDAHVQIERHVRPTDATEERVHRLPLEVLHGDEVAIALTPDLVGLHHVGVVEACGEAGLVEEHREELGVVAKLFAKLLHDEQLVETMRAGDHRQEHAGHPALAELANHTVLADPVVAHRCSLPILAGSRGSRPNEARTERPAARPSAALPKRGMRPFIYSKSVASRVRIRPADGMDSKVAASHTAVRFAAVRRRNPSMSVSRGRRILRLLETGGRGFAVTAPEERVTELRVYGLLTKDETTAGRVAFRASTHSRSGCAS